MRFFMQMLACLSLLMSSNVQAKLLIYLPFEKGDSWYCIQGPGGAYSHKGKLANSFDFTKGGGGINQSNPAFGEWVYSPVKGEVIKVVEYVPDFVYNDKNHKYDNNYGYGNEVIIKTHSKSTPYYVRMLHFKKGSVLVKKGDKVEIGNPIARVGQTGFSTEPHLHIHVSDEAGASTSVPFDFVEGPVKPGSWYKSDITPLSNLLDNDKSSNLGSDFTWFTRAYNYKYWESQSAGTGFTGEDYLVAHTPKQKLKWKFRVNKPGYYLVMVRYKAHPNGDPKALYRVIGTKYYIDQSKGTSDGWRMLGFKYIAVAGLTYQISVEGLTSGRQVSADSIDLIGFW